NSPSRQLPNSPADFVFFAHSIADLSDQQRHFQLSAADIALINPNTRTCPIFRGKQDAELTKYIYRRVPVLINENDPEKGNPWGISFMRMFDMSNDSHLFKTKEQLEEQGLELQGNHFVKGEKRYLPLYEAKMMHQFDYRWSNASTDESTVEEHLKMDNTYEVMPRYWVSKEQIPQNLTIYDSYVGFRNITNVTNERSFIMGALPISAVGHSLILVFCKEGGFVDKLVCNMNAYSCDYIVRQKLGGTNMTYGYVMQFPVIPIVSYSSDIERFILARYFELVKTSNGSNDMLADVYPGPPFIWDEERRFEIRCELDALYFHLYLGTLSEWQNQGTPELLSYLPTPRHAVEYIMETFPIVKRKDEKEYGEYRTKRRILEIYDQMTHCLTTKTVYRSTLNPPPGPPCDAEGNFIPIEKWDKNNWPHHVHRR
ncbi:MAG: hypothetical protein PHY48_16780, partial [Candidatus Cloacimonetes bacterium]|nr:hypothetical protein [Candidatus Cloacimonadota bacterium]